MSDIITEIDKYKRGWTGGLPETPCGFGSKLSTTVSQREWIPEIIQKYGIKTMADIGAGDLNWFYAMELNSDIDVKHYDLVPRAPEVIKFDLLQETPPAVDMIICLWVLNHFPYDHCKRAIENLKASGAKYLMMTDREVYRKDQPPEIDMPYIDILKLNEKNDSIRLIELC